MSAQLDKVEVVEVTHEERKVFSNYIKQPPCFCKENQNLLHFSPMQDEDFPLFDEEVAPIASPDETCIDICSR